MQENKGATTDDDVSRSHHSLTQDLISKLRFRDLQRELERRQLDAMGTTAQLRERLRVAALGQAECVVEEGDDSDACEVRYVFRITSTMDLIGCMLLASMSLTHILVSYHSLLDPACPRQIGSFH